MVSESRERRGGRLREDRGSRESHVPVRRFLREGNGRTDLGSHSNPGDRYYSPTGSRVTRDSFVKTILQTNRSLLLPEGETLRGLP